MLNLNKLDRMAYLSLENALRLHEDAILLFNNGRYASAFAISIISQEEIGKMHIINNFVWHSRIDGRMIEMEDDWLKLLYKHPHKQSTFITHSPVSNYSSKNFYKFQEEISNGKLESQKHNALYVGFERPKGKIKSEGKIKHPFSVTERTAKDQIGKINDYLLVMGIGVIHTYYSLDEAPVESLFTRKLIKSLAKKWPYRSREAEKSIHRMQEASKEKII